MTRRCLTCDHPERPIIDSALVGGSSLSSLSDQHGISEDALARHAAHHVPALLARSDPEVLAAQADDLLGQVVSLKNRSLAILDAAEAAGDRKHALAAIREARTCVELLARLAGRLGDHSTPPGPTTIRVVLDDAVEALYQPVAIPAQVRIVEDPLPGADVA